MANANEQLADVYDLLKAHGDLLRSLMLDVEGLKATMTGADHIPFDRKRKSLDLESATEHAESVRELDLRIARLRW